MSIIDQSKIDDVVAKVNACPNCAQLKSYSQAQLNTWKNMMESAIKSKISAQMKMLAPTDLSSVIGWISSFTKEFKIQHALSMAAIAEITQAYTAISSAIESKISSLGCGTLPIPDLPEDTSSDIEDIEIPKDRIPHDTLVESRGPIRSVAIAEHGSGYTNPKVIFAFPGDDIENKNFELWADGVSDAPTWWSLEGDGASCTREQTIHVPSMGINSVKLTRSDADTNVYQDIHHRKFIINWQDRTVKFGCCVKCDTAGIAYLAIDDGVSTTLSHAHPGTDKWKWIEVKKTISSDATMVRVSFQVNNLNGSAYFAGCSSVITGDSYKVRADGVATVEDGEITGIEVTNSGAGYCVDMHTAEANPWPRVFIEDPTGDGFSGVVYCVSSLGDHDGGGYRSACCITRDGSLKTWGDGTDSKLGQGGVRPSSRPSPAMFSSDSSIDVVYFAENYGSTFCITSDGELWGVGDNRQYSLGLGDLTNRISFTHISSLTKPVVKIRLVRDTGSGYGSVFVWTSDGDVYVWGYNSYGRLGNGTVTPIQVPTKISEDLYIDEATLDLGVAGAYSLATCYLLKANGHVLWAGDNQYGCGSSGASATSSVWLPMKIDASTELSGVKQLVGSGGAATNGYHSIQCLITNGSVFTAGYNANGELGNGTTTSSSGTGYYGSFVKSDAATLLSGIRKIWSVTSYYGSIGSTYAVLTSSGLLYAWGYNAQYQLMDGTAVSKPYATACSTVNPLIDPSQGHYCRDIECCRGSDTLSVLVLFEEDYPKIFTAGYNGYGMLGVGDTVNNSGKSVMLPSGSRRIAEARFSSKGSANTYNLQVLFSDGRLFMCGYNGQGQLGDGTTVDRLFLGQVLF